MIGKCTALLLAAALLLSLMIEAQPDRNDFSVRSSLSTPSAAIGESLTLTLTLTSPEGFRPDIEKIKERLISYNGYGEPPFRITSLTEGQSEARNGKLSQQLTISLQPQTAGRYFLSPKVVEFTDGTSKAESVTVPAELFEVAIEDIPSTPPTAAMIAPFLDLDARLPVTLSYENRKLLLRDEAVRIKEGKMAAAEIESKAFPWSILIAFCAVVLVAALIWVLPEEGIGAEQEKLDLEEQNEKIRGALRRLSVFAPQSPEGVKAYFKEVENTLKQLLDAEYSLHAFTSTSTELSRNIAQLPELPERVKSLFIDVFETADRVKFAKYPPAATDLASASEAAKAAERIQHHTTNH